MLGYKCYIVTDKKMHRVITWRGNLQENCVHFCPVFKYSKKFPGLASAVSILNEKLSGNVVL